jgi:hypothetical protein
MDSISTREPRVLWSFWVAAGLAATGGVAPLLLAAGGTNRMGGAVIPFGIAAMAMAVSALTYQRGRPLATSLYFLAGIALVYGMLSMVAVPLRLAVLGTCSPGPVACLPGFERPLTTGEETGLAIGIAAGTLAILVGFFGLLMLFRIAPQRVSMPPPVRRDAQVVAPSEPALAEPAANAPPTPTGGPAPAVAAPSTATATPVQAVSPPKPRPTPGPPRPKRAPKPQAELSAPAEQAELPAPEEPLELPASTEPVEPTEGAPTST